MTRLFATLALLCATSTAHAGGYLAGGVHGAPGPVAAFATGLPSLKAGFGNRGFAGYGSLSFVRGHLEEDRSNEVPNAFVWGARPMVGLRPALGKADKPVVAVLDMGAYTWLWGLGGDPDEIEPVEQDPDAGLRPQGGLIFGGGLDGRVTENLSISAEVGVDFFSTAYQVDGWVYHGDLLTTWSAVYINIWL